MAAKPTYEEISNQLAEALATIDVYKKAGEQRAAEESLIAEKTALGLSRDQAIAVIKRQKDHDAAEAARKAKEAAEAAAKAEAKETTDAPAKAKADKK